jgi:putative tryptophan/tyrosine transport system substrate-binding protein
MLEIGFLNSGSKAEFTHLLAAFRDGLKLTGYKVVASASKEPKDVRIHAEWADGDYSQLPTKAKLLFEKAVDVIAATGGIKSSAAALKYASSTGSRIPVLFASGRATPKPGEEAANAKCVMLGTTTRKVEDHQRHKRLRELLGPDANIYELVNRNSAMHDDESNWPKTVSATNVAELKSAFQTAANGKADALLVSGDPFFNSRRAEIIQLASKHKLPVCYPWREYVEAGGLMSHGPNLTNLYRRLGIWAGMVLDGSQPKDLPDSDAGHRELVLNLKTAKKLNLPPAGLGKLLLKADLIVR